MVSQFFDELFAAVDYKLTIFLNNQLYFLLEVDMILMICIFYKPTNNLHIINAHFHAAEWGLLWGKIYKRSP
jgi:hypothetical protein